MINNVVLVGRLTRDIELRYNKNGIAYAQFSLAVNRNFKNQNGERDADFISCSVWRQSAEFLNNYARKGSLIGITGRIETSSYDNEQGQRVFTTRVVCDNVQLLESRNAQAQSNQGFGGNDAFGTQNASFGQPVTPSDNSEMPGGNFFGSNDQQNDPLQNQGVPIDTISEDDLPF